MNRTFLLVHGSWQGGWAWENVIRELSRKGHRALAPTLPGHGPGTSRAGITHQDCVRAVVAFIQKHALDGVIAVGHSFGGTVVQKVAEQLPDRIARTVFLDALILRDNESVLDILPPEFASLITSLATASPENTMMIPWEAWRDNFIQDAPETLARSTWERLSPEPNQVNVDKVELKRFDSLAIPKSFIYCRQDKSLGPGYFHPRMSSRLRQHKLLEMDGSHQVMFSRPRELADALVEAAQPDRNQGTLSRPGRLDTSNVAIDS
jgi:pimeloyl-ACP methyl ester carboxylesterase